MPVPLKSSRPERTPGSPGCPGRLPRSASWSRSVTAGPAALAGTAPLLLIAFLGWQLFWMPAVVVHDGGVTLENPFRSDRWCRGKRWCMSTPALPSPWSRPDKSYAAWAAPAPGIWGGRNAQPEDLRGLPATTYGPGQSVRPGDLKTTDSGQAARIVRARWQDLVESGAACRRRRRHHRGEGDVPLGGGCRRRTVAGGQLLDGRRPVARPCRRCGASAPSRPWFRRTR